MGVTLSFIIPVYNCEPYLNGCMDSIYRAGVREDLFEVILVNDGSPDGSATICKDWLAEHSNIVYIEQKNQGASIARNKGLETARGEWVWFVDSDDRVDSDFFRNIFGKLSSKYDVICFNYNVTSFSSINHVVASSVKEEMSGSDYLSLNRNTYLWCKVFRKNAIQYFFLEGTKNIEDMYFCVKNIARIESICCYPDFGYFYNCQNQLSTSRNIKKRNLIKLTQDTLSIQENLIEDISIERDERIKEIYRNELTKTLAGHLFSLMRFYSPLRIKRVVKLYKKWGVYPIKQRTKNKKMNLFICVANHEWVLKIICTWGKRFAHK